jgi:hypothetical protein
VAQAVREIPIHRRQVRHRGRVAVLIVGIGERRADRAARHRGEQLVVGRAVAERHAPVGHVVHCDHVAGGVVVVLQHIGLQLPAVAGLRVAHARVVERSGDRLAADMLAAERLHQPVDGVEGMVGARLDLLVVEIDRLLGVVPEVGDVAHRIVCVGQELQDVARERRQIDLALVVPEGLRIGVAGGHQPDQRKRIGIVFVDRAGQLHDADRLRRSQPADPCRRAQQQRRDRERGGAFQSTSAWKPSVSTRAIS